MINKKGVSGVIAVVFIVLITVSLVIVLTAVLVPFVKDNLSEGSRCLDITSEISLVSSKTCYYTDTDIPGGQTNVTVRLGNVDAEGIYIVVSDDLGNSASCDIKSGEICNGVNLGSSLDLPQKGGGQKTYYVTNDYDHVVVGGIGQGKRCPISEEFDLKKCI